MKQVSVLLSIEQTILTCEICGKGPAEAGPWTLCGDCAQLFETLLQFLKRHDVDPKDLWLLKEIMRFEAREIGLTT